MRPQPILLTGATGYVGGRLAPRLLEAGYRVRAIVRSLGKLACRPWAGHPNLEIVRADVMDAASLYRAAQGCWAAYYLVHSMNPASYTEMQAKPSMALLADRPGKSVVLPGLPGASAPGGPSMARDFATTDRQAAVNMAAAAEAAGLERLIYLGGLLPEDQTLSKHLASRAEVARVLQAGAVPVTWLRAAMILGSGSASFEILRYLCERLPVMITPRWVKSRVQPIAIGDVLAYLQGCLEHGEVKGQALDIGGPEVLTYAELFQIYAQEAGLKRRVIIPVPVFSPKLSSYWISLITPVPAALARPLAEGLRHSVVCRDRRILEIMPRQLTTCRQALARALERVAMEQVPTCWSDAGHITPPEWVRCEDAPYAGGTVLQAAYKVTLAASPEEVWPAVAALGGGHGWYAGDVLWGLRGWLDRLLGGPGHLRGRRDPQHLQAGDALDFWRVLAVEPGARLLLLAEMRLPGQAIMDFRLAAAGPGQCELAIIARFLPRGLMGLAYWYGALPLHGLVFGRMLLAMAEDLGRQVLEGPQAFEPRDSRLCRGVPSAGP